MLDNFWFWLLISGIIMVQLYLLFKLASISHTSDSLFRSLFDKVKKLENKE